MVSSRSHNSQRRIAPGAALRRPTSPRSSQPPAPGRTHRPLPIGQAPASRSATRADPDQHGRLPIGALRALGPPVAGREGSRRRQAPSPSTTPPERRRRHLSGDKLHTGMPFSPPASRAPSRPPQAMPSRRSIAARTAALLARSSSDGTSSGSPRFSRHGSPCTPPRRPPQAAPAPRKGPPTAPPWPRLWPPTDPEAAGAASRSPAPRPTRPTQPPATGQRGSGQRRTLPSNPAPLAGSASSISGSSETFTPASPSRSPAPLEVDLGANAPPAAYEAQSHASHGQEVGRTPSAAAPSGHTWHDVLTREPLALSLTHTACTVTTEWLSSAQTTLPH